MSGVGQACDLHGPFLSPTLTLRGAGRGPCLPLSLCVFVSVPKMGDVHVCVCVCVPWQVRDGVPVLGAVPHTEGAFLAVGHAEWGILLGPATGLLLTELIAHGALLWVLRAQSRAWT